MIFSLGDCPDLDRLTSEFALAGRVKLPGFLTAGVASALADAVAARDDWRQVLNSDDKVFELTRAVRAELTPERATAIDAAVYDGARRGFQYRFESIRTPDDEPARAASDDVLAQFAQWLSSGPARDLLRQVTGVGAIDFADAQATAYAPGDFLTLHHDEAPGKQRHVAFVLGLTPQWRPEWGGLLLFHAPDGDVTEGWVPRFNTLHLFAVPQPHSVAMVNAIAPHPRRSITGWLRSR